MNAPAKLVHIQKPGKYNTGLVRNALCGRRVNLMQLGKAGEATCPRCAIAEVTAVTVEAR